MIGYMPIIFYVMTYEDKKQLKKTFMRFLKEKGIYSFITGEIRKEYNNGLNSFIDYLIEKNCVSHLFNLRKVLTFDWNNFYFWKGIHEEWKEICCKLNYTHLNKV